MSLWRAFLAGWADADQTMIRRPKRSWKVWVQSYLTGYWEASKGLTVSDRWDFTVAEAEVLVAAVPPDLGSLLVERME